MSVLVAGMSRVKQLGKKCVEILQWFNGDSVFRCVLCFLGPCWPLLSNVVRVDRYNEVICGSSASALFQRIRF